jgi:hypothetical protein
VNRDEHVSYHIRRLVEACQQVQPSLEYSAVQCFDLGDLTMLVVPELMGKPTVEVAVSRDRTTLWNPLEPTGRRTRYGTITSDPEIHIDIYADWAIRLIHPDGTLITHVDCKRAFLREWWTKEVSNEQDSRCEV